MNRLLFIRGVAVGLVLMLPAGCGKKETKPGGGFVVNVVGFTVQPRVIEDKINLVGTLEANEQVEIKSEIDGVVEEITFAEGQPVKKDDVLFSIDQRKLAAALQQAQANLQLAETTARRYEELVKTQAVSQQEYDQTVANLATARAALVLGQEQLEDATIKAPFDGTMGERLVSTGQFVSKGASLGFLVDYDPVKVSFYIPERYLGDIRTGQKVEMTVAAYPEETFTGEVYFIDPTINQDTRTALVKGTVPNPQNRLRPGMFAGLNLITRVRSAGIAVPESALMVNLDTVKIYVADSGGTAHSRSVKTGMRFDGMVEITDGLAPGEVVVTEGIQKIRDGAKVNLRLADAAAKEEPGHEAQ